MLTLPIFELILCALITFYLLHIYAAKDVPRYVKVVCFTAWFFSFAILVFVPLDILYTLQRAEAAGTETQFTPEHESKLRLGASFTGMVSVWKIVYWTSFLFTWVILPLLQEYVTAGEFTVKDKMKRSIKVNVIGYAIMALFGVVFIAFLQETDRVGKEGIMHFLITFSNCFGIVLIILCLSYGLVYIPKRCFQQTRQKYNLRIHQYQAAIIEEQKEKTQFELEDIVKNIEALLARNDVKEEDKQVLRQILALAPEQLVRDVREMIVASNTNNPGSYENYSRKKIITLHKKMKKKLALMRRFDHKWDATSKRAFFLEDLIDSDGPEEWRSKLSYTPTRFSSLEGILSVLEWIWHQYAVRVIFFFIGLAFVGFSLIVFSSEISTFSSKYLYNFEKYLQAGHHIITRSQILCIIPLSYMLLCVYAALFNMKFAGRYGLYRHHQTDSSSLIFASLAFTRVSPALVFNFLQMVGMDGTAFEEVMGNVHFAYSFTKYFPSLLVVLVVFNLFNVYGRVLSRLGLNRFKFDQEFTNDKIEEGKKLLSKSKSSRIFSIARSNARNKRKQSGNSDDATSANSNSPRGAPKSSNGYMMNSGLRFSLASVGSLDAV